MINISEMQDNLYFLLARLDLCKWNAGKSVLL